jgi:hypothetical protein
LLLSPAYPVVVGQVLIIPTETHGILVSTITNTNARSMATMTAIVTAPTGRYGWISVTVCKVVAMLDYHFAGFLHDWLLPADGDVVSRSDQHGTSSCHPLQVFLVGKNEYVLKEIVPADRLARDSDD